MAKTKMMCPFSGKFCKECPLFIGRHYYLCDNTKYRGYLGNKKEVVSSNQTAIGNEENLKSKIDNEGGKQIKGMRGEQGLEMPVHITQSPCWLTADKVTERTFDTH